MKPFATGLADIQDATLRALLANCNYSNAGLAIGTTKSKVKTANAIDYTIDGIFYSKAATDDLFVHTDVTVQAVGTTKLYALCLDASGNASIIAGPVTQTVDGITYTLKAGQLPPIPATKCLVGVLKIVTDATHTFTPATTLNDAAGITATYINVARVPAAQL